MRLDSAVTAATTGVATKRRERGALTYDDLNVCVVQVCSPGAGHVGDGVPQLGTVGDHLDTKHTDVEGSLAVGMFTLFLDILDLFLEILDP